MARHATPSSRIRAADVPASRAPSDGLAAELCTVEVDCMLRNPERWHRRRTKEPPKGSFWSRLGQGVTFHGGDWGRLPDSGCSDRSCSNGTGASLPLPSGHQRSLLAMFVLGAGRPGLPRPADRRAVGRGSACERGLGNACTSVEAAPPARRSAGPGTVRLRAGARRFRARRVAVRLARRAGTRRTGTGCPTADRGAGHVPRRPVVRRRR